jgi:hypothetical protein
MLTPVTSFKLRIPIPLRAAGRLKPATGAALGISCKQVFYSPSLPAKTLEFRAQKNRLTYGVRIFPPVGGFKLLGKG